MTTTAQKYHSELFQTLAAEAEARGEVRGEARALLTVLQGHGMDVPDEIRDHILACTDPDQLQEWLQRVATAQTIDDVITG